jgi:membrane protease YdiL (CAAX protease family)
MHTAAFAICPLLPTGLARGTAVQLLLVAPLLEEVVLRAGLHDAWLQRARSPRDARLGLLVTTLAFGVAHALSRSAALGLAVMPAAAFIGWVYQQRRRLLDCIGLHAFLNLGWLWLAGTPLGRLVAAATP